MSIIDQALKKTQQALNEKKTAEQLPASASTLLKAHAKKARMEKMATSQHEVETRNKNPLHKQISSSLSTLKNWTKNGILALSPLLILGGVMLFVPEIKQRYIAFYSKLMRDKQLVIAQHVAHTPMASITPFMQLPPLQLNGTVLMNGENVAMINHHMYHTGDRISGFKITHIDYDAVDLLNPNTHQQKQLQQSLADS